MSSRTRGLRNIRTISGRLDAIAQPYQAYMQITCLEMEKARRGAERRSASQRIGEIDERLKEIEAEKAELLRKLPGWPASSRARLGGEEAVLARGRGIGGLKLRY